MLQPGFLFTTDSETKMKFTLAISGSCEGPYTRRECRDRVEEIFGSDWFWREDAAGSFEAVRCQTFEVLAIATPVGGGV